MIDFAGDVRGIQLQLLIERLKYERWVGDQVEALLIREYNRVVDTIISPTFRTLTNAQQARKFELFRELDRQLRAAYITVDRYLVGEMQRYAAVEHEIARAIAAGALPESSVALGVGARISTSFLRAIATMPIQGLAIGDWFEAQANTMSMQVRRTIQNGLVEGKGPLDIARRIVADQRAQGAVVSRRAVSEARAITRTVVTAVHNAAAMDSYQSLSSGASDSYRYVAVLDSRTSQICRALDGNAYRYDDPKKKVPPQHLNCRSTTIPLLRGGDATLTEQRNQPLSIRSYESWLKAQSSSTQNDILGPTRGQQFRDGTLSLAEAIDQDQRVQTLVQLRARLGLSAAPAPAFSGAF